MLEPTPELPDDTLISSVEFPARIRTVLAIAGLETVGEVRETSEGVRPLVKKLIWFALRLQYY
jgi:hypothetical protein